MENRNKSLRIVIINILLLGNCYAMERIPTNVADFETLALDDKPTNATPEEGAQELISTHAMDSWNLLRRTDQTLQNQLATELEGHQQFNTYLESTYRKYELLTPEVISLNNQRLGILTSYTRAAYQNLFCTAVSNKIKQLEAEGDFESATFLREKYPNNEQAISQTNLAMKQFRSQLASNAQATSRFLKDNAKQFLAKKAEYYAQYNAALVAQVRAEEFRELQDNFEQLLNSLAPFKRQYVRPLLASTKTIFDAETEWQVMRAQVTQLKKDLKTADSTNAVHIRLRISAKEHSLIALRRNYQRALQDFDDQFNEESKQFAMKGLIKEIAYIGGIVTAGAIATGLFLVLFGLAMQN